MKVRDVMNRNPVTVKPDARVHQVLETMVNRRATGVSVVDDDGRLLGFIPERNLIVRELLSRGRWREAPLFTEFLEQQRQLYGRTAADVMNRDVVTASEFEDILGALARMAEKSVSRLPVVHAGRVVGELSRSDILACLLELEYEREGLVECEETDEELAARVRNVIHHQLDVSPLRLRVSVADRVARLEGIVSTPDDARALEDMVRDVCGVRDVVNALLVEQLAR